LSIEDSRSNVETEDLMFDVNQPWWLKHRWLRRLNYLALAAADDNYARWKRSRVSPRRYVKMLDKLDKDYSIEKFSIKKLIGREKELNLLLDSFRFHVLRHPRFLKWFGKEDLPKAFCITGESGAGKTFMAMVGLRQMILEANRSGLQISPIVVRGSDVYSEFYGKSTKQLANLLKQATNAPSVVYIDEFQSFGRKVRGETSADMEDTRVQDELNRWLDTVLGNDSRTLVIMATNAYETTREDIRRRLVRINLDAGMTRDMLLAIVEANLQKHNWSRVSSEDVLKTLERHAAIRRKGSVTPNDVASVFKEVKRRKEEYLRSETRERGPFQLESNKPMYEVYLEDFESAASVMKFYSDQQKSQQVTDAVCVEKPDRKRVDIGGLHDIKNKLLNQVALALNPDMSKLGHRANSRFMLLGPPGTGKTLLALVAAAENNVCFIQVRGGELMSGASYLGEPEKRISDLFALARQKAPCILFLDEADAIFWGADPASNKILAQVKAELSDLETRDRIVIIAASNKEQFIDQATRDRFEPNIYYIHPPLNDSDWQEVVEIHLRFCKGYLEKEVEVPKITSLLRRQRAMSPRGVAETIAEAHRLWASELSAAWELLKARKTGDSVKIQETSAKYKEDLNRLCGTTGRMSQEPLELDEKSLTPEAYKIRLSHFVTAIENLESLEDKSRREAEESLISTNPPSGVSHGLYTTERGDGGILAIQCAVRPAVPSESRISVTGQATSAVLGQVSVPDCSVVQSAENAVEAAASWLWEKGRINLAAYHVHYQIRSLLEGAPGQGVSGPSAGFAMFAALLSELSNLSIAGSKVLTGTIGVKLDVGPVGGLGGLGRERGKLVGILKTQKMRVTDLFLPEANCRNSSDEMQMLRDEGLVIHSMSRVDNAICQLLDLSESELLSKIRDRFKANRFEGATLTARLV